MQFVINLTFDGNHSIIDRCDSQVVKYSSVGRSSVPNVLNENVCWCVRACVCACVRVCDNGSSARVYMCISGIDTTMRNNIGLRHI